VLGKARSGASLNKTEEVVYNKMIAGDLSSDAKIMSSLLNKLANTESKMSLDKIDFYGGGDNYKSKFTVPGIPKGAVDTGKTSGGKPVYKVDGKLWVDINTASAPIIQVYSSNNFKNPLTARQKAIGGQITYSSDGAYTIHTFATTSVFTPLTQLSIEYLLVAGGGAGGSTINSGEKGAGGGGAGGLLTNSSVLNVNENYVITVGAGGTQVSSGQPGNIGSNSSAFSNTVSGGGGGGGGFGGSGASSQRNGSNGGSGGGGGGGLSTRGLGTAGQGNDGANSTADPSGGSGGGGKGAAGSVHAGYTGGTGGIGFQTSINGTATYYAGGVGGGQFNIGSQGTGGLGGGGNGGSNAIANTGGGGGGGSPASLSGGNGGSGIVIIRYAT
jgi:hypothetical protein